MSFLKKIFSIFFLFISISFLLYTIYRSEIYWDGLKRNYYQVYYLISFGLIFFSIFSFFISQNAKKNFIIFGFGTILTFYFFEIILILNTQTNKFPSSEIKIRYEKQTGRKFDTRNRIKVYTDLKKKYPNIKIKVAPTNHLHKKNPILPLSGISNSRTIYDNENGYYSIYQSDRYGFNNPDDEWDSQEIEFLLVGDSFTHGSSVNRPFDIASQLRKFSKKSVLNLGYDNNGPLINYATLREYLTTNVKNIIWIFDSSTNFKDLNKEFKNKILNNYLIDPYFTQDLKLKQKKIDEIANKEINDRLQKLSLQYRLFKFFKIYNTRRFIFNEDSNEKIRIELLKNILNLAKVLSTKNSSKIYFVYLPEYKRYKNEYDDKDYQLVKEIVYDLNIPFIDIHERVFAKEKNPLEIFSYEQNAHYTKEGYRKVSESIYNFIENFEKNGN